MSRVLSDSTCIFKGEFTLPNMCDYGYLSCLWYEDASSILPSLLVGFLFEFLDTLLIFFIGYVKLVYKVA